MKRHALLLLALVSSATLGACNTKEKELNAALAEARTASAEKDSLLSEVLAVSAFVSDVNTELAKVKGLVPADGNATDRGVPGAERDRSARSETLGRIGKLIERVTEAETQLDQSKARLSASGKRNTRLLAQIDTYKQQLDTLRTTMETQQAELQRQQAEIAMLKEEVDTARAQNASLTVRTEALTDTVQTLTHYRNTAYYIVGTKRELMEKGIVQSEGSKFLIFGGKHLVPARNLPLEAFTPIDLTNNTEIALPKTDKTYKIVSPQDLASLADSVRSDGKVKGAVRIAQPEQFWAPSKYLILVEN